MPKNKRSKKRKARKIDVSDVTDTKMQETEDALKGGSLSSRKDHHLFFVDKNRAGWFCRFP